MAPIVQHRSRREIDQSAAGAFPEVILHRVGAVRKTIYFSSHQNNRAYTLRLSTISLLSHLALICFHHFLD
ncbi:hypothetical protein GALMADRAFT_236537 [Galerina marginata CBS 339.88]|uniref:Uncharacterized protein n=1 Tax=Galerina marginata (strain CBS 339.88) TaxID=685588 RepID=A0A067TY84_GALM3|nr:hypothetical protein GALMADRAFT_236537 [Galerina marginata CBS 339.88]